MEAARYLVPCAPIQALEHHELLQPDLGLHGGQGAMRLPASMYKPSEPAHAAGCCPEGPNCAAGPSCLVLLGDFAFVPARHSHEGVPARGLMNIPIRCRHACMHSAPHSHRGRIMASRVSTSAVLRGATRQRGGARYTLASPAPVG